MKGVNEINESTPFDHHVKGPNMFERAKEEIEAIVEAIHHRNESKTTEELDSKKNENGPKAPNLIERVKEEIEAIVHHDKSPRRHDKETHGRSDDIDENTAIDDIRGPSFFERAKEEFEAIVETIHHKKEESNNAMSPVEEERDSFGCSSLGRGLEKVCSPWGSKRD
ncbi:hypothetical protein ACFE04_019246 [Oxalis oulophora]